MKPITVWKRFDDYSRSFEHNHIEDGHVVRPQDKPISAYPAVTKDWAGGLWVKKHGWLDQNNVVILKEPTAS